MSSFICEGCGGAFDRGWTESEAHHEARQRWGEAPPDGGEWGHLCDDCDEAMMAWLASLGVVPGSGGRLVHQACGSTMPTDSLDCPTCGPLVSS